MSLLRQTIRRLAHERGFTATVLLTLALCIGANVAIFAVVDAILLRPLPFPEARQLVTLRNSYPGAGAERSGASIPNYYDRRDALAGVESLSIVQNGSAIVGESGAPTRVRRDRVSPEFFATLGVPLARGRAFSEEELNYENSRVLVITHEFWQNQFGGREDILGREITIDGQTNEVVGVLPPGFRYLDSNAQFFIPYASSAEEREPTARHSNNHQMIARMKPGVSVETVQEQMNALNAALLETDPFAELLRNARFSTMVISLHEDVVRSVKDLLLMLQAGVLALLIIGAVNLINLLLIRANGRAKEFALRQALGAGHGHLAREIIGETVLLAVCGGVLGILVGIFGIDLLATLGTDQLPLGVTIAFDGRVALVCLSGAAMLGLVLSVPLVVYSLRHKLAQTLQTESRGGTVSRAAQQVRYGFIVAQVAITFALLSGAGLLGLSLKKVLETPPGFEPDNVLTARLSLPWQSYQNLEPRQAFQQRLLTELRAQPGVEYVGLTDGLPFSGGISDNATTVEGVELAPGESIRTHYTSYANGDYFQAVGIPLITGRFLTDEDDQRDQRVAVVDQAFVNRYWPDGDALGRRIAMDVELNDDNAMTIVGVVGTIKQNDMTDTAPLGSIYVPFRERGHQGITIAMRTSFAPEAMAASLRRVVLSIDPELPVDSVKLLQARIDDSLVTRRSPALLAGVFAGMALLLAGVGTYGVLAYAVSQRRREIGVRMALGALPGQILRQFLSLGSKLLLGGLLLGAALAFFTGRAMQSLLFEVPAFDALLLSGTGVIMGLVGLLAVLYPSQRAARVSPMEALRDD